MSKVATLTGHTLRVLYLAMSPDGQAMHMFTIKASLVRMMPFLLLLVACVRLVCLGAARWAAFMREWMSLWWIACCDGVSLCACPAPQTIVTGAGDETLRFWNVFPGPKTKGDASDSSSMLDRNAIR